MTRQSLMFYTSFLLSFALAWPFRVFAQKYNSNTGQNAQAISTNKVSLSEVPLEAGLNEVFAAKDFSLQVRRSKDVSLKNAAKDSLKINSEAWSCELISKSAEEKLLLQKNSVWHGTPESIKSADELYVIFKSEMQPGSFQMTCHKKTVQLFSGILTSGPWSIDGELNREAKRQEDNCRARDGRLIKGADEKGNPTNPLEYVCVSDAKFRNLQSDFQFPGLIFKARTHRQNFDSFNDSERQPANSPNEY